jgi:hypothetical protein
MSPTAVRSRRAIRITLLIVGLLVVGVVAGFLWPTLSTAPLPPANSFAIVDVTLIDGTGAAPRTGVTVVVENGRIKQIAPDRSSAALPDGTRVIDGSGRFLIPGLWDMHVHGSASERLRTLYAHLLVANGVTGVRKMDTDLPSTALGAHEPAWNAASIAPRQIVSGRMFNGSGALSGTNLVVESPAEVPAALDSLAHSGSDFVKVYNGPSRETFFALMREAKKRGLVVAGHVPWAVNAGEAADSGQKSIEHTSSLLLSCTTREQELRSQLGKARDRGDYHVSLPGQRAELTAARSYDAARCRDLAAQFIRNGTWLVPTLVTQRKQAFVPEQPISGPDPFGYIAGWRDIARQRREWGAERSNEERARDREVYERGLEAIRLMREAGVPLLAGSDMPATLVVPGFSLHDELGLLVEAGLTPMQAIQSATIQPARYFGVLDSLGTAEVGKVADLVLLDADPLADIGNTRRIAAVVLRGGYLDRAELDGLLKGARRFARRTEVTRRVGRTWCTVAPCKAEAAGLSPASR